jgi:hypothetical protein
MACVTISESAAVIMLVVLTCPGVFEPISDIEAAESTRPTSQSEPQAQSQGAPPNPDTLMRRYETSLSPYRRMRGRWTLELEESLQLLHQRKPGEVARIPNSTEVWAIFRDDECMRLTQTKDTGRVHEVFESLRQRKQQVSIYSNGHIMAWLQRSAESDRELLGASLCSPCYGIIDGKWIPGFLRTVKLSVEEETREGRPLYRLRGITMDAKIELWIDPSLDYAARRIRFDKRVSEADPTVRSHEFDATRFRLEKGHYVVTEATTKWARGPQPVFSPKRVEKIVKGKRVVTYLPAKDENGNVIVDEGRWTGKIKLRDIEFDPKRRDHDLQFSRPIANGTRVAAQDAPESHYVWKDGKVVLVATGPAPK